MFIIVVQKEIIKNVKKLLNQERKQYGKTKIKEPKIKVPLFFNHLQFPLQHLSNIDHLFLLIAI